MMRTLNSFKSSDTEKWKDLMKKQKVFKDHVKKRDIWLTRTEVDIIDTPEFQRLRRIFQLGPANLLFMGANHTRFEHSIGTLYKAQCIVDGVNSNYENFGEGIPLDYADIFVIRLSALLHDVVFIAYGHILEDEGRIFKSQWEDEERANSMLSEHSNIGKTLKKNLNGAFGNKKGGELSYSLLNLIKRILSVKNENDIAKLGDYAFAADITQNTICADLLDYLERDVCCTGVFGEYDTRMISYFIIEEHHKIPRLIIRLYKRKVDDFRWDVVNSGILACLRLRRNLAASIYFHHTRKEASAMIIKMVSAAMRAGMLNNSTMRELDDFSLLYHIRTSSQENSLRDNLSVENKQNLLVARLLAERLQDRQLYKPILRIGREDFRQKQSIMDQLVDLTNWQVRYDFEASVERVAGVEPGSVILYIPDKLRKKEPKMFLKEARTLVKTKYGVETLEELGKRDEYKPTIGMELDNLKSSHKALFEVLLLAYPGLKKKDRDTVAAICEEWLKCMIPTSAIAMLENRGVIDLKGKSVTHVASELYEGFKKMQPLPGKASRLTHFVSFAENRFKKLS